ncbi:hydrogenase maturation peptidase HycI [Uliginosibacterium sediminicola]|uniref:Hydrogenase maturation peptidase HycI n=1 Tax=Uliginosibacterium sediminicola TaxID=2024550 RepID=A0ABU9YVX4_9RHOO
MPNVILTVGNSMMGDDGAGPLLAELLNQQALPGWVVIDGGSTPENVAHEVEALKPPRVLIVDAAEIGLTAGEIRLIDDQQIAELFIITTHNLPLSFLIEGLRASIPEILFLGIQTEIVAFGCPMSDAVRHAVHTLHAQLLAGQDPADFETLQGAEQ